MAEPENIPDLNVCPLEYITPTNRAAKRPSYASTQPSMVIDADDSDIDVEPTSSAPPVKRTREGQKTSAIDKLTEKPLNPNNDGPSQTLAEKAMDKCSEMFAEDLSDNEFVGFINVLENESKARTFLTLSQSSTPKRCEIWLKKEALKLVSCSF